MHTVKWLQVLLSKNNRFICTQLNGLKYCYITLTIQFNISHFVYWLNNSIWHIDWILKGTTSPGQGGSESNFNEGVLLIPQALRLEPHNQMLFSVIPRILLFIGGNLTPLQGHSQCIQNPSIGWLNIFTAESSYFR